MGEAAGTLRDAAQKHSDIHDSSRLDAELLLAHPLGISREQHMLLDFPNLAVPAHFDALVQRRLQSEPAAHILGTKEFLGSGIPGIARCPDSPARQ